MKKMLITLLLLAGLGTGLMAQNNTGNGPGTRKANSAYVDANKNNVCDNRENKTVVAGRGNGYGRKAGYGPGQGRGQGRCGGNGPANCRRRS